MSRTLRSPMVRGSTVLLGLGVLLWLLLRAPVSAPHHGLQAYAPFQVLARVKFEPRSVPPRSSDPVSVLRPHDASCSPTYLAHADHRDRQSSVLALTESPEGVLVTTPTSALRATVTDVSPVRAGNRKVPCSREPSPRMSVWSGRV